MSNTRKVTPRETNAPSNPNRSHKRPNPLIGKTSVDRTGRRSFETGGKLCK